MERAVVKKEHNFLKIICIVLGFAFTLAQGLLAVYGIDDDASVLREAAQYTGVLLAAAILILTFYIFVCRKLFPASKEYKMRFSDKKVIAGIYLICPFLVFVYANLVSFNFDHVFEAVTARSFSEVMEDLMFFPAIAFIGPIFEEMCFRVMGISLFSTKRGRIIAWIVTSILFALIHGASFLIHIPSALIYGGIMLYSRNIALPMILHMAWNTATFVVPTLSDFIVMISPKMNYGIWGSPIAAVVLFAGAFVFGLSMIIKRVAGISGKTMGH